MSASVMPPVARVDTSPPVTDYGGASFDELRYLEFGSVDRNEHVYLDHTGAARPLESVVRWHADLLVDQVLGNPHSANPSSSLASEWEDRARARILDFVQADPAQYTVAFAPNTSGAIKLVAEAYQYGVGSTLLLAGDSHNSVLGIREFAKRQGARVVTLSTDKELRLEDPGAVISRHARPTSAGLLAYSAQSNFSGVQHPLDLVRTAHAAGFDVLLDLAAYATSNEVLMDDIDADFAVFSIYKITGYPTGIGALIGKRTAFERLVRPWFSGGTVASVDERGHVLHAGPKGLEDGTLNFQAFPAVDRGLATVQSIGMRRIKTHVMQLTARLLDGLLSMRHMNGTPVAIIHGPEDLTGRGSTVAFTLTDPLGHAIPRSDVMARANTARISLRDGQFCAPLVAASHGIGALCGKPDDQKGGALRVSMGMANNNADIDALLAIVATFCV